MDFVYKSRLGKHWDTTSLKRILDELGVSSLQDAIAKERESLKTSGASLIIKPQDETPKNEYSPPKPKPKVTVRLPYADNDDPPF